MDAVRCPNGSWSRALSADRNVRVNPFFTMSRNGNGIAQSNDAEIVVSKLLFFHPRRVCSRQRRIGGAGRDRTDDLKLAKLPLSQLSYSPTMCTGQSLRVCGPPYRVRAGQGQLPNEEFSIMRRFRCPTPNSSSFPALFFVHHRQMNKYSAKKPSNCRFLSN